MEPALSGQCGSVQRQASRRGSAIVAGIVLEDDGEQLRKEQGAVARQGKRRIDEFDVVRHGSKADIGFRLSTPLRMRVVLETRFALTVKYLD